MATTTSPEQILVGGNLTGAVEIGSNITIFQVGVHGSFYDTVNKRYARRIAASGGGGGGYVIWREMPEPRTIVDPKYGTFSGLLRLRDTLAITIPTGVPVGYPFAQSCFSRFGYGPNQGGAGTPFVGFVQSASWAANTATAVAANTWTCVVVDDGLVQIYTGATIIPCTEFHELELVMDGNTNTISWYIDNVLVGAYAPASGAAPGQQNPYPDGFGTLPQAWNLVWSHSNTGSSGGAPGVFNTNYLYRMAPFGSILSWEFSDG